MKNTKWICAAVAGALALSLAACGGQPGGEASSVSGSASSGASSSASSASGSQGGGLAQTAWFGRVSAVAGNEITLELAVQPPLEQPEAPAENPDGTMDAVQMVPATPAEPAGGDVGAEEREELEYSGETMDFTIPGGLAIQGADGSEKQLSDIQKGSILSIAVNEDGQVIGVWLNA